MRRRLASRLSWPLNLLGIRRAAREPDLSGRGPARHATRVIGAVVVAASPVWEVPAMSQAGRLFGVVLAVSGWLCPLASTPVRAAVTQEEVERAIREGVRYLKQEQRADGSWSDVDSDAHTGSTSLVTLALLTAGERADSPTIRKALNYLRNFGADDLKSTYAVALQTMVFAAAEPERDQLKLVANVDWLTKA